MSTVIGCENHALFTVFEVCVSIFVGSHKVRDVAVEDLVQKGPVSGSFEVESCTKAKEGTLLRLGRFEGTTIQPLVCVIPDMVPLVARCRS